VTTRFIDRREVTQKVRAPRELEALRLRDLRYGQPEIAMMLGIGRRRSVRDRLASADRKIEDAMKPPDPDRPTLF
jgi:predicted DNA-binding protein (UPF0251 family)